MFKSLVATAGLLLAVYWVASYSFSNGVFKFKRSSNTTAPGVDSPNADLNTLSALREPTPTPLPPHFPEVEPNDLRAEKSDFVSLADAYNSCWPGRREVETPTDGVLTTLDIENLFGKVRKRELIETNDKGTKWGLLFDESIFQPHAVGAAIEVPNASGSDVKAWKDVHLRAAGRMLHCENANSCGCL